MKRKMLASTLAALSLVVGCEKGATNAPSVQDYEQKRAELIKRQERDGKPTAVAQGKAAPPAGKEQSQDGSGVHTELSYCRHDTTVTHITVQRNAH